MGQIMALADEDVRIVVKKLSGFVVKDLAVCRHPGLKAGFSAARR
jgi:hypothetical protein